MVVGFLMHCPVSSNQKAVNLPNSGILLNTGQNTNQIIDKSNALINQNFFVNSHMTISEKVMLVSKESSFVIMVVFF